MCFFAQGYSSYCICLNRGLCWYQGIQPIKRSALNIKLLLDRVILLLLAINGNMEFKYMFECTEKTMLDLLTCHQPFFLWIFVIRPCGTNEMNSAAISSMFLNGIIINEWKYGVMDDVWRFLFSKLPWIPTKELIFLVLGYK